MTVIEVCVKQTHNIKIVVYNLYEFINIDTGNKYRTANKISSQNLLWDLKIDIDSYTQ